MEVGKNSKARSQEIYSAAVAAVEAAGGVTAIDKMSFLERQAALHELYKSVAKVTTCHRDTAKRNVAKSLRKGRYAEMVANWGGPREGSGYPKGVPRKKNNSRTGESKKMFNLSDASQQVRKAAYLAGVKSGQFEPVFDPAEGPAKIVGRVYNRNYPDGVVITQGDADYADHFSWSELKEQQ